MRADRRQQKKKNFLLLKTKKRKKNSQLISHALDISSRKSLNTQRQEEENLSHVQGLLNHRLMMWGLKEEIHDRISYNTTFFFLKCAEEK